LIEAVGDGISVTNTETPSIGIANTRPGFVQSGTIDQSGFTGPDPTTGLYYKDVTVVGMYPNGLILVTTSGTPAVCYSAWIATARPDTGSFRVWLSADPVQSGETWEAHYGIISFGTA
jgi:hypothetical protein